MAKRFKLRNRLVGLSDVVIEDLGNWWWSKPKDVGRYSASRNMLEEKIVKHCEEIYDLLGDLRAAQLSLEEAIDASGLDIEKNNGLSDPYVWSEKELKPFLTKSRRPSSKWRRFISVDVLDEFKFSRKIEDQAVRGSDSRLKDGHKPSKNAQVIVPMGTSPEATDELSTSLGGAMVSEQQPVKRHNNNGGKNNGKNNNKHNNGGH